MQTASNNSLKLKEYCVYGVHFIENLGLSSNAFTGILPKEISNLINLEIFSVFDNNLFGPIPSNKGQMSKLEQLVLSNNNFYGQLPSSLDNPDTLLLVENNFTSNLANLQLQMPNIITLDVDAENKKGVLVIYIKKLVRTKIFTKNYRIIIK